MSMYTRTQVLTVIMVITMSVLLVSPSQGRKHEATIDVSGGRGYVMMGTSMLDIDELNTSLSNAGYSELSDNFFTLGGGGHAIINRIIIGGEGHGLMADETTTGNYTVSLTGGYGLVNVGYLIFSRGGFHLYPLLGIGGGAIDLKIHEREAPSFDEILDDPKRGSELSTGGFLLNVSIGADHLFILGGDEEGEGGLVLGLRAGYTFTPIKGDWNMYDMDVGGGPDIGITGPYFHLMLGGGGVSLE